jgi:hypothetical protein
LRKQPVTQQHGRNLLFLEEDVAKLCCLFLLNGNRISQQRFIARRSPPSGRNLSSN